MSKESNTRQEVHYRGLDVKVHIMSLLVMSSDNGTIHGAVVCKTVQWPSTSHFNSSISVWVTLTLVIYGSFSLKTQLEETLFNRHFYRKKII